ncbi:hypothetical protein chiPu_0032414, partial [Chiloscyllium punctatum]|nr:hypothetical protein [Chiloscyllium punctatum]
ADLRAAARAHRVHGAAKDIGEIVGQLLVVRERLARGEKEAAIERPGGAADRHHQGLADHLERLVERLRRDGVEFAEHGFATALHVGPVVAVADRLIEARQLRRAGDDLLCGRLDQRFECLRWQRHLFDPLAPLMNRRGNPLPRTVETQRMHQLQIDLLAGLQRLMRIRQRHQRLALIVQMNMILLAEVLDPMHA